MWRSLAIALAAAATIAIPLSAQHEARQHGPRGGVPETAPKRDRPDAPPDEDQSPHVSDGHWFGHASPNDERFRLDRPFEHGRFGRSGPSHHFSVVRFDRDSRRLWFRGGFGFEIAPWEWSYATTWCWTCGDDFIVYDDPDHDGWYLLYYIPTGHYVHVQYLGT